LSNRPAYRQEREQYQKDSHRGFDDGNPPLIKSKKSNRKNGSDP
jgi:hypothetical protein